MTFASRSLFAGLVMSCSTLGRAGDLAAPPRNVHVDVQMVALPTAEALSLVPRLRRPEAFVAAHARIQALLASGEATLLGWPLVHLRSGAASRSASVREVRFEEERCDPGGFVENPSSSTEPAAPPSTCRLPACYVIESAGPTLEAEAMSASQRGAIHLSLVAQFRWLQVSAPAIGARMQPEQWEAWNIPRPKFAWFMVQTELAIPDGGCLLLGAFVQPPPQSGMVLFLLHAAATPKASQIP